MQTSSQLFWIFIFSPEALVARDKSAAAGGAGVSPFSAPWPPVPGRKNATVSSAPWPPQPLQSVLEAQVSAVAINVATGPGSKLADKIAHTEMFGVEGDAAAAFKWIETVGADLAKHATYISLVRIGNHQTS